jgi:5-methylcytosine-specific restriction endonuclease McrA
MTSHQHNGRRSKKSLATKTHTDTPRLSGEEEGEKKCIDCGVVLPAPSGRGRPRKRCMACAGDKSAVARRWREANPTRVEAYNEGRRRGSLAYCSGCGLLFESKRDDSVCAECSRKRRRARETARAKRSREQATGDLTAAAIVALKAAAQVCPLCEVELSDEKRGPRSKHLDHVVPLVVGGAHSVANVRVICESCNLRRPKDGSDVEVAA